MRAAGGYATDDLWFTRMKMNPQSKFINVNNIDCEAVVYMDEIGTIYHENRKTNYRPVLPFSGRLLKLNFLDHGDSTNGLPYNITGLDYSDEDSFNLTGEMLFEHDQFVSLVEKGYFEEGFQIPSNLAGTEYELPVKANLSVLLPDRDGAQPIFFADIDHLNGLEITRENSGYDLLDYIPDQRNKYKQEDLTKDSHLVQNRLEKNIFEGLSYDTIPDYDTTPRHSIVDKVHEGPHLFVRFDELRARLETEREHRLGAELDRMKHGVSVFDLGADTTYETTPGVDPGYTPDEMAPEEKDVAAEHEPNYDWLDNPDEYEDPMDTSVKNPITEPELDELNPLVYDSTTLGDYEATLPSFEKAETSVSDLDNQVHNPIASFDGDDLTMTEEDLEIIGQDVDLPDFETVEEAKARFEAEANGEPYQVSQRTEPVDDFLDEATPDDTDLTADEMETMLSEQVDLDDTPVYDAAPAPQPAVSEPDTGLESDSTDLTAEEMETMLGEQADLDDTTGNAAVDKDKLEEAASKRRVQENIKRRTAMEAHRVAEAEEAGINPDAGIDVSDIDVRGLGRSGEQLSETNLKPRKPSAYRQQILNQLNESKANKGFTRFNVDQQQKKPQNDMQFG